MAENRQGRNETEKNKTSQNTYSPEKLKNDGMYKKPSRVSTREDEDFSGSRLSQQSQKPDESASRSKHD